tara:strand:- start:301 stop:672 length:372 start_codon:yes stop_codon:yes gene_type:complete
MGSSGQALIRKLVMALLVIVMSSTGAIAGNPTKLECEANQKAASAAADDAVIVRRELHKAAAAATVGVSCLSLLYLTGWLDFGLSAALCTLATAGAVVAVPTPVKAQTAAEAYNSIRDPRCVQ